MTLHELMVLEMLDSHGPMRFTVANDITACELLYNSGYIKDHGDFGVKKITKKGQSVLSEHSSEY